MATADSGCQLKSPIKMLYHNSLIEEEEHLGVVKQAVFIQVAGRRAEVSGSLGTTHEMDT